MPRLAEATLGRFPPSYATLCAEVDSALIDHVIKSDQTHTSSLFNLAVGWTLTRLRSLPAWVISLFFKRYGSHTEVRCVTHTSRRIHPRRRDRFRSMCSTLSFWCFFSPALLPRCPLMSFSFSLFVWSRSALPAEVLSRLHKLPTCLLAKQIVCGNSAKSVKVSFSWRCASVVRRTCVCVCMCVKLLWETLFSSRPFVRRIFEHFSAVFCVVGLDSIPVAFLLLDRFKLHVWLCCAVEWLALS